MSRGPHTFKQSDLTRAVKAVQAAGLTVIGTEIHPDGRIVIVHTPGEPQEDAAAKAYVDWKERRLARGARGT